MKIFLAYRFTGVDPVVLQENINQIVKALNTAGHEVWNSLSREEYYQQSNFSNKQKMQDAFENIDRADTLLAFINSAEKSEGMLLEIGYAIAKSKKFILAIQKNLPTVSVKLIPDQVLEFDQLRDLCVQLEQLKN